MTHNKLWLEQCLTKALALIFAFALVFGTANAHDTGYDHSHDHDNKRSAINLDDAAKINIFVQDCFARAGQTAYFSAELAQYTESRPVAVSEIVEAFDQYARMCLIAAALTQAVYGEKDIVKFPDVSACKDQLVLVSGFIGMPEGDWGNPLCTALELETQKQRKFVQMLDDRR